MIMASAIPPTKLPAWNREPAAGILGGTPVKYNLLKVNLTIMKETAFDETVVQQIKVGNQTVPVDAEIRCLLCVVLSSVFRDGLVEAMSSALGANVVLDMFDPVTVSPSAG